MYKLLPLALLALTGTSHAAFKVTFKRFSDSACSATHKINEDTHLEHPKCKTFDHDEPGFEAFKVKIEREPGENRQCKAEVYADPECKGHVWEDNDLVTVANDDTCVLNEQLGGVTGRSVRIQCEDEPETIVHVHTTVVATAPVPTSDGITTITLQAVPAEKTGCCDI